jgi:hypothetical protein
MEWKVPCDGRAGLPTRVWRGEAGIFIARLRVNGWLPMCFVHAPRS